jgi:chromosome segregation ATPase
LKQEIENQKRTAEEKIASANQPLLVKVAELQKTLDDKEQLIAQKAEAFTKVSGELATVLKGLAVIREERDNLSASVRPLEAQIKSIPQEIALAKKPVEEENARLKVEVEKVQGMLDVRVKGLEADLDAKNAAYDEMVAGRRDFEKEMARITQENDKLSEENQRFELKLSKKFQEECGVAMEELQKPWKDKIDDLKSQLDGRDKEIESMKNENGRLNQELSNLAPATK